MLIMGSFNPAIQLPGYQITRLPNLMTPTTAAREFIRLIEIVARLRAPGGCPWDREQTIDSLKPFVLEETYEVLQAIDRHHHAGLAEELGDFRYPAVFLAQLESEAGHFAIAGWVKSS